MMGIRNPLTTSNESSLRWKDGQKKVDLEVELFAAEVFSPGIWQAIQSKDLGKYIIYTVYRSLGGGRSLRPSPPGRQLL